ncbi:MAG: glycosyltransferase family 2 protein [Candidatus Binatia bacterium]
MSVLPFVSVMIPVRNEAASIRACLESVLAQDYPPDRFEVLVVDGASTDESAQVVGRYARRTDRVRLLENPRRIVPSALNIAIRAARGDIVMRVDGHTRIAPDYMRVGVETLKRTGADNVGGPMRPVGGGLVGDAIALATSSRFGIGSYFHFGRAETEVDTVYMGMYPRAVFEHAGLFDEEMVRNQDDEFNYRLRKAGGRVVLAPAMHSVYQNRQSLRALAKQFAQYGFWKVRVVQKHPRQTSVRHFIPPAFVLAGVGLLMASPWLWQARAAALLLGTTYAGSVGVVAARLAHTNGWRFLLPVAAAFVTLHLSWGAGFVLGLGRFATRWFRSETPPPQLRVPAELHWQRPAAGP